LRLDQNQINEIRPGAFSKMPKLNELVLTVNKISTLPDDFVHPDAPLERGIKLEQNDIKTFPLNLLKKTEKVINVARNPIHCDCNAVIPQHLKHKVIGKCASPGHLNGRRCLLHGKCDHN